MQAKNFLCNNLTRIDLKNFLISVQKELDKLFLENMPSNLINVDFNVKI